MSAPKFALRDLVYLDFDKAASIWSQCQQGLPDRMSVTEDSGQSTAAGTKFGLLSIAGANLGVDYLEKRSTLESRTLHHDVLNRVELHLADSGLVTDLSVSNSSSGRRWKLDHAPAVGDPTHMVEFGTGRRAFAREA